MTKDIFVCLSWLFISEQDRLSRVLFSPLPVPPGVFWKCSVVTHSTLLVGPLRAGKENQLDLWLWCIVNIYRSSSVASDVCPGYRSPLRTFLFELTNDIRFSRELIVHRTSINADAGTTKTALESPVVSLTSFCCRNFLNNLHLYPFLPSVFFVSKLLMIHNDLSHRYLNG